MKGGERSEASEVLELRRPKEGASWGWRKWVKWGRLYCNSRSPCQKPQPEPPPDSTDVPYLLVRIGRSTSGWTGSYDSPKPIEDRAKTRAGQREPHQRIAVLPTERGEGAQTEAHWLSRRQRRPKTDPLSPSEVDLNDGIVTSTLGMLKISFPEMNMDRKEDDRMMLRVQTFCCLSPFVVLNSEHTYLTSLR